MKFTILAAGAVAALSLHGKTTPIDKLQAEVRNEQAQNIQLHDLYRSMEDKDEATEKKDQGQQEFGTKKQYANTKIDIQSKVFSN